MANVLETSSASVQEDGPDVLRVNQYTLKGKLGEGAYGVVLECEDDKHSRYALKMVSKSLLKRQKEYTKVGRKMLISTAFDDVKREIALMKKLHHPRIVSLVEIVDDPDNDKLFMIMELVDGGQVMDWDKNRKGFVANPRLLKPNGTGCEMSEECARLVLRDVVEGLDYLHRSRVVHRDLKPQNLLLTSDKKKISVKIADFGVSHMFEGLERSDEFGESDRLTKVKGTYFFYSPESLGSEPFDGYKADIWALGINLHCFLSGKLPFYDENPIALFEAIAEKPVDYSIFKQLGCSEPAIALMQKLLEKNPENRFANARAVMDANDPWLGDFEEIPPLPQKAISISEADISNALTTATLSIATVATLKIFVQKWRKRASLNASRRKDGELVAAVLLELATPPSSRPNSLRKVPSGLLTAGSSSSDPFQQSSLRKVPSGMLSAASSASDPSLPSPARRTHPPLPPTNSLPPSPKTGNIHKTPSFGELKSQGSMRRVSFRDPPLQATGGGESDQQQQNASHQQTAAISQSTSPSPAPNFPADATTAPKPTEALAVAPGFPGTEASPRRTSRTRKASRACNIC